MTALTTFPQCQREPVEYPNNAATSKSTSESSCSTTPRSTAPHTPYPRFRPNPPSHRPHSFVTAEGYIIEEFSRSRCISEPSRPRHRRFNSTPNANSPGRANHLGAHRPRPSTNHGHSTRRPSPLAFPPSPPAAVPIADVPVPYIADSTSYPNDSQVLPLPASPAAPIWPSSPRGNTHVTQNLKLKKPRPRSTIEHGSLRPSFVDFLRSLFTFKAKQKEEEGRPTPNTLVINRHYTSKFIPPPPAGIRFSKVAIS